MLSLLAAAAAAAAPYAGLEWRPLSRGDLAWVEDGNTTDLLVGGLDGFVRPQMMGYVGAWVTPHIGLHGALGVARLQTTTWEEDIYVQRHWGVVRPEIDLRTALLSRDDPRPIPWLLFGFHADLPSARDTSNGYSPEEVELADQTATTDRIRLGAIGGRIGAGADLALLPSLRVGLQCAIDWQRSLFLGTDPNAVTSWTSTEAALVFELHWPDGKEAAAEPVGAQ